MKAPLKANLALKLVNQILIAWLLLTMLPLVVKAQFNYTNQNGSITITRYTGPGGVVIIPETINGLPVTSVEYTFPGTSATSVIVPDSVTNIGINTFAYCSTLTNVALGSGVAYIGQEAFFNWGCCASLITITVDPLNPFYSSLDGVLFNKSRTTLILYPQGRLGGYIVPDGVAAVGPNAFQQCDKLTSVIIPNGVTNIDDYAFANARELGGSVLTNIALPETLTTIGDFAFLGLLLTNVTLPKSLAKIGFQAFAWSAIATIYFLGNAPSLAQDVFLDDTDAVVYYLPGTTGWGATYGGLPTMLWNPHMQTTGPSFGVRTNRFGFAITGTSNLVIVLEASTDLADAIWLPLSTNILTGGSSYFSDPDRANHPTRFYRLRPP
jgi:hypothetical protein